MSTARDLSLSQINAGNTAFEEQIVSPAVSSLLGFSSTKVAQNVTLGDGLALTAGVVSVDLTSAGGILPVSKGGTGQVTIPAARTALLEGNQRAVFEGDSLTTDNGLTGPTGCWPYKLITKYGFPSTFTNYVNAAVSGQNLAQMLSQFSAQILPSAPVDLGNKDTTWAFLWGGQNDSFRSEDLAYADAVAWWALARAQGMVVVAFTLLPLSSFNAAFNVLVRSNPSLYDYLIETDTIFSESTNQDYFYPDHIHLRELGNEIVADEVYRVISKSKSVYNSERRIVASSAQEQALRADGTQIATIAGGFIPGTGDFSVACVCRFRGVSDTQSLVSSTANGFELFCSFNAIGTNRVNDVQTTLVEGVLFVPDNNVVGYSRISGMATLWLNGIAVLVTADTANYSTAINTFAARFDSSNIYQGDIRLVGISTNGSADFVRTGHPSTADNIAGFSIQPDVKQGGFGTTWYDASGNSNSITWTTGFTWKNLSGKGVFANLVATGTLVVGAGAPVAGALLDVKAATNKHIAVSSGTGVVLSTVNDAASDNVFLELVAKGLDIKSSNTDPIRMYINNVLIGSITASGFVTAGTLAAGNAVTVITDANGKVLSAALNTIAVAQGGTGSTSLANGTNIKHKRVSTGSIASGGTAAVTVTWTNAFADANYTPVASIQESTNALLSLRVVHINSYSASAVVVLVTNDSAGSLTGTLQVIAIHD